MYNRYIPQADGSYCRRSMPEKIQKPAAAPPQKVQSSPPPCPAPPQREQKRQPMEPSCTDGILQRLLPGGLDTEDLIIILLLLLIAGNCREDQNFALLTLGLYLFM